MLANKTVLISFFLVKLVVLSTIGNVARPLFTEGAKPHKKILTGVAATEDKMLDPNDQTSLSFLMSTLLK